MRPTPRGIRLPVAAVLLAALLTGCGIRATEVPTDFGPAPSRAPCSMSATSIEAQPAQGIPVQVFLLCTSQLVTVDRSVRIPSGSGASDRIRVAQALLDQLAEEPSTSERQAGYTSDVRGGMTVSGPRGGDPDDTLRLAVPPQDLSSFALAQIICTLARSAAADPDGAVVLGGPDDEPVRAYLCTTEVRSRPGTTEIPSSPAEAE